MGPYLTEDTVSEETGTAVAESETSTGVAAGSAPAEKTGGAGSQVEGTEGAGGERGIPRGAYEELKSLRQFKRQARDYERRIADLESRIAAGNRPDAAPQKPDLWTDPDGFVDSKVASAVGDAITRAELKRQGQAAYQYIRSQEGITADAEEEIADIMRETGLDALVMRNPQKAAELAIREWRERNGLPPKPGVPDNETDLARKRAQGVAGAAAAGGKKVWTVAEVSEIAKNPEQYAKHRDEILAAQTEGRIR